MNKKLISGILAGLMIFLAGCGAVKSAGTEPEVPEVRSAEVSEGELQYFSFGKGEKTFVIFPGASVTSVMNSAAGVAAAYAGFTKDYTVYLFETRTDMPDGYTVEQMAEDAAEAMEKLGIEGADILGCSLGGMIGQCLAVFHPELVNALVLASTSASPNDMTDASCGNWAKLAREGKVTELNRQMFDTIYSPEYYEQYKDVFASMEEVGTPEELRHFAVTVEACTRFDIHDRLSGISCPVLVIGSWGDKVLSGEASVQIARAIPAELFMYTNYGHAAYDEAPDFKDRMMTFFAR